MFLEELAIVGETYVRHCENFLESVRQGHFPKAVMMAVGFSIRGYVDELRPCSFIVERGHEALRETVAAVQEFFKRDGLRNRCIVEKERDGASCGKLTQVGSGRIDSDTVDISPMIG